MKTDMDTQHNLSEQVLERIKRENITPRTKQMCRFCDYATWTTSVASLLFGSVSFGIFLDIVLSNDWDIFGIIGEGRVAYFLSVIPYLWVVFALAFLFYARYFFNNTDRGYNYLRASTGIASISLSAILGVGLYYFGIARGIDDYLVATIPYYHEVTGNHTALWSQPEKGLLSGEVLSVSDEMFALKDWKGELWKITFLPEIESPIFPKEGEKIKMTGKVKGPGSFEARDIHPWIGEIEPNL